MGAVCVCVRACVFCALTRTRTSCDEFPVLPSDRSSNVRREGVRVLRLPPLQEGVNVVQKFSS